MKLRHLFLAAALALGLPAAPAFAAPAEVVTSPGGITAWLIEDHANPLIAVHLTFRGGAAEDPADRTGLATMVSGLLDEGAGDLDSRAYQDRLDALNVSLGFSAARDGFDGDMQTLTANRDAAFDLLRLALTQPRFDDEPVARMREAFQTRLRQRQESPGARASDAMFASLFPTHPYARPTAGTEAGLAAIGKPDLQAFVRDHFTRDRLIVGVVGDIDPKTLGALLDRTFGALPAASPLPPVADAQPVLDGGVHAVAMPIPQATALFVQKGPARNDPDWQAFQVMMYVLGDGGFSSRLTAEVREKRGLAYGVSAGSAPLAHAPLVVGSVGTQTARMAESLAIIRSEWAKMAKSGAAAAEVDAAKSYLIGSTPLRLNSSGAIAETLTALQYYHLPPDELDRRAKLVGAVTAADVKRVAAKWLTPDKLTVFVVGEVGKMNLPNGTQP